MVNVVPSAPEQAREQVSQFWYAEGHLGVWSFFLPVRAEWPVPRANNPEQLTSTTFGGKTVLRADNGQSEPYTPFAELT
jgi:hypothetical protein